MSVGCESPPGFVAYSLPISSVGGWGRPVTDHHWRYQQFGTRNVAAAVDQLDANSPREVVTAIKRMIPW